MSGIRLEAKVHIVTGAQSAAENIIKCVRRCGLEVEQLMLNPLASSRRGADRRREGAGRGAGRHRRRHHRRGDLHRRRDPPHGGDPDRRRPDHQRHRDGAAHADQGRRGHQGRVRLRQAAAGRPRAAGRSAGPGRPRPAHAEQAGAGRRDRAARRGDLLAGAAGDPRVGLRGSAVLGHRAHRRQRGDAGHGRTGRGHLPQARAPRHAELPRRAVRHGGAAARRHRDGPAGRGAHWRACAATRWRSSTAR